MRLTYLATSALASDPLVRLGRPRLPNLLSSRTARGGASIPSMAVRLVDRCWGDELVKAVAEHAGTLRIVCPFIKAAALGRVLGSVGATQIEVITRFNLADFGAGVSDIAALEVLLAAGARIRGVRGLHAKVFVFGDGCAAVTSANLTMAAFTRNEEFGCMSEDEDFIAACNAYFEELWLEAGEDLDMATLSQWNSQISAFLSAGGRRRSEERLPDHGADTPSHEPLVTDGACARAGGWTAEFGTAYVKFFGEGDNRAPWSLGTLEEVRRSGSHWACTYPTGRRGAALAALRMATYFSWRVW